VVRLQTAKAELGRQVAIYEQLALPLNYSQVVGTLSTLVPESVALTELELRTEQIKRRRTVPMSASAGDEGGKAGQTRTVVDHRRIIHLDVRGIAPNDVVIANLIGELAASGLFEDVKMAYSRQGEFAQALTREFLVSMQVPLDRDYVAKPAESVEEVADARGS
jgi:Tfp pilus assembly protein PilN